MLFGTMGLGTFLMLAAPATSAGYCVDHQVDRLWIRPGSGSNPCIEEVMPITRWEQPITINLDNQGGVEGFGVLSVCVPDVPARLGQYYGTTITSGSGTRDNIDADTLYATAYVAFTWSGVAPAEVLSLLREFPVQFSYGSVDEAMATCTTSGGSYWSTPVPLDSGSGYIVNLITARPR